jgi:hypothetical protein
MKKAVILFSACVLFAGLTFAQTPQTKDKEKTPAKTENASKKGTKDGCDKKDMKNCMQSKDAKSGCCAHGTAAKKDTKEQAPEKK